MARVRTKTLRVQNLTLNARCFGSEQAPIVLFFHGYLTAARTWDAVCSSLASDFQCIAIDFPACGDSPVPLPAQWSLEAFVDICDGLLDSLGLDSVDLVGSQMGGSIAAWYTARQPKRVKRLTVMASGVLGESSANMGLYRALASPWTGWLVKRILPRKQFLQKWIAAHGPERGPNMENFDHYFRQFRRTADAQTKIALGVRTSFGESFSELAPLLSSLKTPTLLLFGEADRIVPPATGERFHELLSNSRLIKIPGCGDFPQEEFPEVVADEICTFLTEGLERAAEGG